MLKIIFMLEIQISDWSSDYNEALLGKFHTDVNDFQLSSNEPPPLEKIPDCELQSAVFNGELNRLRLLVEVFHCSLLVLSREGYTALHIAAASGELTILKYLVEDRLVNAATKSLSQETPLHCAAKNGHLPAIKYLVEIQMVDPLAFDGQQLSSLHCACTSGSLNTVQYLMEECQRHQSHGLNERTSSNRTLVHYAAVSGSSKVLHFLLTSSYLINDKPIIENDSVNSGDMVSIRVSIMV